ncbi:hypothetical protein [Streptomyces californicus]|uniref:hypothetical protein n=1 Tax=Streptomyces californicus TaxID=67351 RepID=UPI003679CF5F
MSQSDWRPATEYAAKTTRSASRVLSAAAWRLWAVQVAHHGSPPAWGSAHTPQMPLSDLTGAMK